MKVVVFGGKPLKFDAPAVQVVPTSPAAVPDTAIVAAVVREHRPQAIVCVGKQAAAVLQSFQYAIPLLILPSSPSAAITRQAASLLENGLTGTIHIRERRSNAHEVPSSRSHH